MLTCLPNERRCPHVCFPRAIVWCTLYTHHALPRIPAARSTEGRCVLWSASYGTVLVAPATRRERILTLPRIVQQQRSEKGRGPERVPTFLHRTRAYYQDGRTRRGEQVSHTEGMSHSGSQGVTRGLTPGHLSGRKGSSTKSMYPTSVSIGCICSGKRGRTLSRMWCVYPMTLQYPLSSTPCIGGVFT